MTKITQKLRNTARFAFPSEINDPAKEILKQILKEIKHQIPILLEICSPLCINKIKGLVRGFLRKAYEFLAFFGLDFLFFVLKRVWFYIIDKLRKIFIALIQTIQTVPYLLLIFIIITIMPINNLLINKKIYLLAFLTIVLCAKKFFESRKMTMKQTIDQYRWQRFFKKCTFVLTAVYVVTFLYFLRCAFSVPAAEAQGFRAGFMEEAIRRHFREKGAGPYDPDLISTLIEYRTPKWADPAVITRLAVSAVNVSGLTPAEWLDITKFSVAYGCTTGAIAFAADFCIRKYYYR